MLRSLELANFTVFEHADLRFSRHLNVLIGDNGTGKTHLLKLPYSVMTATTEVGVFAVGRPTKAILQRRIADKLVAVMRPESLGRLARRRGRRRTAVRLGFADPADDVRFSFAAQSKSEVVVEAPPSRWLGQAPAFLPTRELLSIYPGFAALYDGHHVEFEETWRDTCQLLGAPAVRGRREERANALLAPLEELMGGQLSLDRAGRFYLRTATGKFEMPLVAEGLRKLGMVARLITTGALVDSGCLFWDEPETNLNPRLIRGVAEAILSICAQGVQVFVATHSLFLLREFDVLLRRNGWDALEPRFFGLGHLDDGIEVQQGDTIDTVDPLVLLDEDLRQSDRYMAIANT